MTVYLVRKGKACLNFDEHGAPSWSETTATMFSRDDADVHAKSLDGEVVTVKRERVAYHTMRRGDAKERTGR